MFNALKNASYAEGLTYIQSTFIAFGNHLKDPGMFQLDSKGGFSNQIFSTDIYACQKRKVELDQAYYTHRKHSSIVRPSQVGLGGGGAGAGEGLWPVLASSLKIMPQTPPAPLKYFLMLPKIILQLLPKSLKVIQLIPSSLKYLNKLPKIFENDFRSLARIEPEMLAVASLNENQSQFFTEELSGTIILTCIKKSRKENPQKLTQLSSRSHPRLLVGKRTAQKDTITDITSDSKRGKPPAPPPPPRSQI